ncbi:hypothetical protein BCR44DRAFT_1120300 [Catenaria anguillulae PL171]|uniref:Uncharacterized protein n=1 Tax=Catenaria anguillulae PL171 TaxID=765915 RepID=A0A1Y2HQT0_9FUNG|nr:hypothetical protein BCR44DRAFT_1120300 [Catenaria anguillulae PL171]
MVLTLKNDCVIVWPHAFGVKQSVNGVNEEAFDLGHVVQHLATCIPNRCFNVERLKILETESSVSADIVELGDPSASYFVLPDSSSHSSKHQENLDPASSTARQRVRQCAWISGACAAATKWTRHHHRVEVRPSPRAHPRRDRPCTRRGRGIERLSESVGLGGRVGKVQQCRGCGR